MTTEQKHIKERHWFNIGTAHRNRDGKAIHWTPGIETYPTLEKTRSTIDGLFRDLAGRGITVAADEFIPIETKVIYHAVMI
jgi:hypothetical protein